MPPPGTVVMEDRQGQREEVPLAEARARFDSRQWGFPNDTPVGVYNREGRSAQAFPASEVGRLLRGGGEILPTVDARRLVATEYNEREQQRYDRALQEEYGDVGSQVATAAEGFASEATFGAAPYVLGAISPEYETDQRRRAQANPGIRAGAEMAGAVLPLAAAAFTPGGQGAAVAQVGRVGRAVRAVGRGLAATPAGQVGRLALNTERAVAVRLAERALGTGGATGRAAMRELAAMPGIRAAGQLAGARAVGGVAGGAIEGLAMGLTNELQRVDLEGDELTAGSLADFAGAAIEGVATGAVLGGGIGGLAGFLGSHRVADALNNAVDGAYLRSFGTSIPAHVARRYDGNGSAAIGGLAQDLGIVTPTSTRATILNTSRTVRDDAAVALEGALDEASAAGARIGGTETTSILGALDALPIIRGTRKIARKARQALEHIGGGRRATVVQAWRARRRIDQLLNGTRKSEGVTALADRGVVGYEPMRKALVDLRRQLEDAVEGGFNTSGWRRSPTPPGERLGYGGMSAGQIRSYITAPRVEALQRIYVTNRQNFEVATVINDMVRRQSPGIVGTLLRNMRRSPMLRGASGGARGAAVGAAGALAAGNPMVVGGILSGAIVGASMRRGRMVLPWLGDKALQGLGIRRQARVVQERIRRDVNILDSRRTFRPNPRLMGAVAGAIQPQTYDAVAEQVRNRAANPSGVVERAAARAPSALPAVAGEYAARAGQNTELLNAALPRGMTGITLISHLQNPDQLVSDQEKAAFLRFKRMADNPMTVMQDLRSGLLSYEGADALRQGHPTVYRAVRDALAESLRNADRPPPYEVLLQISTLFPEVAPHPSLEPAMIQLLQAPYVARETGSVGGQMSQGPGPTPQQPAPNLADLEKTRVQQIDSQ